jgi:hypothetical protein
MKSSHRVFPLNRVHEVTVKKSPIAEQNIMLTTIPIQLVHQFVEYSLVFE